MRVRPMKKHEVLKAWAGLVLRIRDAQRRHGMDMSACSADECDGYLDLLHASVAMNLRTFSVARAKAWASECAELVRNEEA